MEKDFSFCTRIQWSPSVWTLSLSHQDILVCPGAVQYRHSPENDFFMGVFSGVTHTRH